MIITTSTTTLLNIIKSWQKQNQSIALVPTMGNLHNGHLKLISLAKKKADIVIVSIFINKMQFNCINDFKSYPRTLKKDYILLNKNVDLIFTPKNIFMYPDDIENQTFVKVPFFSSILEGSLRKGHYIGVTTIISKFFNLIQPNYAIFGKKDFQQLFIIKKMVKDLNYNIKIIGVSTVRSKDGLALSSRNNNLTIKERCIAPELNIIMNYMANFLIKNSKDENITYIVKYTKIALQKKGFRPDGIFICDPKNLKPINIKSKKAIILISAWLGNTRLIDNIQININKNL